MSYTVPVVSRKGRRSRSRTGDEETDLNNVLTTSTSTEGEAETLSLEDFGCYSDWEYVWTYLHALQIKDGSGDGSKTSIMAVKHARIEKRQRRPGAPSEYEHKSKNSTEWDYVWKELNEIKIMIKEDAKSNTSIEALKHGPVGKRRPVVPPRENEIKPHNWTEAKERKRGIRRCFRRCGLEFSTEAEEINHYRKRGEECSEYDTEFLIKVQKDREKTLSDPGALINPLSRKG